MHRANYHQPSQTSNMHVLEVSYKTRLDERSDIRSDKSVPGQVIGGKTTSYLLVQGSAPASHVHGHCNIVI